ncbi:MAG: hypothetical protein JSS20_07790 [Proteobacteria bacterium]|nr:hypothetical protein [Pseudomonadota bacterium]
MSDEVREPARYPGQAPIEAYGNGGFRFAGMSHRGSLLCLPDAIEAWAVGTPETVEPADFRKLIERRDVLDFVIFGSGAEHRLPSPAVREMFKAAGLSFDVMATGPAARTYNVLLAEGRRVGAALIAVS